MGIKHLAVFLLVVLILLSCNSEVRQAHEGLDGALADLPMPDGFELALSFSEDFTYGDDDETCYYAREYIVYGTMLPEDEATGLYLDSLQDAGWSQERAMELTRILTRGANEYMEVGINAAGWLIESDDNYRPARERYPTLIIVLVTYILPEVDGC